VKLGEMAGIREKVFLVRDDWVTTPYPPHQEVSP